MRLDVRIAARPLCCQVEDCSSSDPETELKSRQSVGFDDADDAKLVAMATSRCLLVEYLNQLSGSHAGPTVNAINTMPPS